MGWTSYHATEYQKGKIDRKKEVEKNFNLDDYEVIKSAMYGSTYYAAIKTKETGDVLGYVCLTSVDNKDYYNFAYKGMSEDMGPYAYDCPASILKLLTPTESEYANDWRKACWDRKEEKKILKKLPEKTKIYVEVMDRYYTKTVCYGKMLWLAEDDKSIYIPESRILNYGFKIA